MGMSSGTTKPPASRWLTYWTRRTLPSTPVSNVNCCPLLPYPTRSSSPTRKERTSSPQSKTTSFGNIGASPACGPCRNSSTLSQDDRDSKCIPSSTSSQIKTTLLGANASTSSQSKTTSFGGRPSSRPRPPPRATTLLGANRLRLGERVGAPLQQEYLAGPNRTPRKKRKQEQRERQQERKQEQRPLGRKQVSARTGPVATGPGTRLAGPKSAHGPPKLGGDDVNMENDRRQIDKSPQKETFAATHSQARKPEPTKRQCFYKIAGRASKSSQTDGPKLSCC